MNDHHSVRNTVVESFQMLSSEAFLQIISIILSCCIISFFYFQILCQTDIDFSF